jgi:hypothetical protein
MTSYNERCRAIAEQMAEVFMETSEDLSIGYQQKILENMLPLAEIAVQFGADMYEKGVNDGFFYSSDDVWRNCIEQRKTDLGLVKPNDIQVNGNQ